MGAATFAIGILPTFEAIGLVAPILLLLARLAQGFSAGGEWGIANAFLLEVSPRRSAWLLHQLPVVTVAVGSGLASAVTAILVSTLSPESLKTGVGACLF